MLIDQIIEVDIVEEQVKRMKGGPVNYERLEISVNRNEINDHKVDYLFDEKQVGVPSGEGTFSEGVSKMSVPLHSDVEGDLKITITVKDEFKPIFLTHYAIKSANEEGKSDPKDWELFVICPRGERT